MRDIKNTRRFVNISMLMRIVGWLLMIEAAFMLIPLVTSIIYEEDDFTPFLFTVLVTFAAGESMTTLIKPRSKVMGKREGFLLTASVWVVFSFFGMIPFLIGRPQLNVSEAFFESMAGFTTTGASIINNIDNLSHGINIWRCLMQWIGGMGIILFTLAVLPALNSSSGVHMFNAEVTGITHDKLRPRVSSTAKQLWGIYLSLTVVLIYLLYLGPMDLFESICHAMSTMSTGGFSTRDGSIGAWNSLYVKSVITIFMFFGGMNFALIYRLAMGQGRTVVKNEIFRDYLLVIFASTALLMIVLVASPGHLLDRHDLIDPLFQTVSTLTSTGFLVTNFEHWGPFAMMLMIVLMFCGACAGSTTGGAKLDRVITAWKFLRNEIYRSIHPNIIKGVSISGKVLPADVVTKAIAFLGMYLCIIVIGALMLTALGLPFFDSVFSSFSCTGNTGLGAGITGYGGSYDMVSNTGKWILSGLMLTGRLEIFTVLTILTPAFWKR
ncbi:MAG: TrkH family potassium uptake protein [Muribaculaceae bacterium]|nr:TrkH family potassium uptake protein [Muribaculaceae bacterium]